jgi:hypothetical protein
MSYQTEELNRMDLDFGTAGLVLIPHTYPQHVTFAMTADKSGYLYVMPAEAGSLGQFQPNDSGLTSGAYTTQPPFQVSRLPKPSDQSVCESIRTNSSGQQLIGGIACDEIHELAWFNYTGNATPSQNDDLLFVWPVNETVEVFQGTLSGNSYSFGISPVFDPCAKDPSQCAGTNPPFPPAAQQSVGGAMAIAANGINAATLWAVVPILNTAQSPSSTWGTLYAYTVSSDGSLNHIWDNVTAANKCSSPPAPNVTGWYTPSFTEPTLANGAVYVPTVCAVTNGLQYSGCPAVPTGSVGSGVLVFTACSQ